jgi:hypothetical protein
MPVTFLGVGIVCFVKRRDIPASAAKPVSLKYFWTFWGYTQDP